MASSSRRRSATPCRSGIVKSAGRAGAGVSGWPAVGSGRTVGGDAAHRGAVAPADRGGHSGRRDPAGQSARPARAPDLQGSPRASGGVGHKAQVVDNVDASCSITPWSRVILRCAATGPGGERVARRTGRPPRTVTADRGYGESKVDAQLADLGVATVVIPRKGRPLAARAARSTGRRSGGWSSGAPAARAGSARSSAATGGTTAAPTAPKAPGSGPGSASSPTT